MNYEQYIIQYNPKDYGYTAPRSPFQMTINATSEQVAGMLLMAGRLVGSDLVFIRSSDGRHLTNQDMNTDPHLLGKEKSPDLPTSYKYLAVDFPPDRV